MGLGKGSENRSMLGAVAALGAISAVTGAVLSVTTASAVTPPPVPPLPVATPSLPVAVPSPPVSVPSLPVSIPTLPSATPTLPVAAPSLPVVTPTLPLPSPSLPVVSPSLPVTLPIASPPGQPGPTPTSTPASPMPQPSQAVPGAVPGGGGGGTTPSPRSATPSSAPGQHVVAYRAGAQSNPGGGGATPLVALPGFAIPDTPFGIAVLVAIAALPMLIVIGLIVALRVWGTALSLRGSRLRMALASELELRPRELAALSPSGLLKLRDQVAFDDLTGVLRRVAGVAAADREVHRARRGHTPLTAVFVDLDGLKRVNDAKGHQAGDAFIRGVASVLSDNLRGQDLVFRYGGDEFVCLLPGMAEQAAIEKFTNLRSQAMELGAPFSFGVAELRPHEDLVSFLGRADQHLYQQRGERGHNGVRGRITPIPVGPVAAGGARRTSI